MDEVEPEQPGESPANENPTQANNEEHDNVDGQQHSDEYEHQEAQDYENALREETQYEETERERDKQEETPRKDDPDGDEDTKRESDQRENDQQEEPPRTMHQHEDNRDEEPPRRSERQRSSAAISEYFKIKARIPTLREKVNVHKLKLHKRLEKESDGEVLEPYLDTRYADKVLVSQSQDTEARAMPRYTTIGVVDPNVSFINDRVVLPQINGRNQRPDRHDRTKSATAPNGNSQSQETSKDREKHIYCRLPSVYGRANSVDLCRPGTRKHDH